MAGVGLATELVWLAEWCPAQVKEIPLAFEKVTKLFHQDIFQENWDFGTEDH